MMKRSAVKHTPKEIAELFESDDELPESYDETPDIPSYLKDDRFTKVELVEFDGSYQRPEENNLQTNFVQHQGIKPVEKSSKKQSSPQEKLKVFEPEPIAGTLNNKKILISKGILTKRDLFLVKSIEEYASDATLLWFIDFLSYKDMKAHQRSCLVAEVMDDHSTSAIEICPGSKIRYCFKLVVN